MIKKVAFLFFAGIVISVIIGCGNWTCRINGIRFYARNNKGITDTLKNELSFAIDAETQRNTHLAQNNFSLISSAYATQVFYKLENYILTDEMELRFDSDIYFDDNLIEANSDLWNNEFLKDYKSVFSKTNELGKSVEDAWVYIGFGFDKSVFEHLVIPPKLYSIELTCRTNDGQEFVEKIDVYINNE